MKVAEKLVSDILLESQVFHKGELSQFSEHIISSKSKRSRGNFA
jgi:hypothetical protein